MLEARNTPRWCWTERQIDATDVIVVGVNQAQRVDSDVWWRADLQTMAEAKQPKKP